MSAETRSLASVAQASPHLSHKPPAGRSTKKVQSFEMIRLRQATARQVVESLAKLGLVSGGC